MVEIFLPDQKTIEEIIEEDFKAIKKRPSKDYLVPVLMHIDIFEDMLRL